jgi:hypothetical protein
METQHYPAFQKIRLQGEPGGNILVWFDGFSVEYSAHGETVLRGRIADKAD